MVNPLVILRESIKAVPSVKWALGLAGIASSIAIIQSIQLDYRVAVLGTVVMLIVMTALVIFARLSTLAAPDFRLPALVLTWCSLSLVIATAGALFLSVFFRFPVDLQNWLVQENPHLQKPRTESKQGQTTMLPPAIEASPDGRPNSAIISRILPKRQSRMTSSPEGRQKEAISDTPIERWIEDEVLTVRPTAGTRERAPRIESRISVNLHTSRVLTPVRIKLEFDQPLSESTDVLSFDAHPPVDLKSIITGRVFEFSFSSPGFTPGMPITVKLGSVGDETPIRLLHVYRWGVQ
jgi:hypothetical protein